MQTVQCVRSTMSAYNSLQTRTLGQQDGLADKKVLCHQAWPPEFDLHVVEGKNWFPKVFLWLPHVKPAPPNIDI